MKKSLKMLSLATLCLFALTGCGPKTSSSSAGDGGSNGSTTTSGGNADKAYHLKIAGPADQSEFIKGQVQKYLDNNGWDKVTFEMADLGEDKADTTVTDWTTGPEIYAFASDKMLNLVKANALNAVPTRYADQMADDMNEAAIGAGTLGDNMVAYPYAGDNGYFLYYDKALFAGKEDKLNTVEGIIEVCQAAGRQFCYPLQTQFYSMAMLQTFGASYTITMNADQTDIAQVTATYDEEGGVTAGKGMMQLIQNPGVLATTTQNAPTEANGIGAVVDGSWNSAKYAEALTVDGVNNLGACKLPTITVDGKTENLKSFLGYKLYGVNAQPAAGDTTRIGLLHSIANYLVSEKVQSARFDAFSTAPTNVAVSEMEKVTSNQYIKAINDQSQYAIPQTITPPNLWTAPDGFYSQIVDAKGTPLTDKQIQDAMTVINNNLENLTVAETPAE